MALSKLFDIQKREVCEKYILGISMNKLAEEYEVNLNTIRKCLNNNSIEIKSHGDRYNRKYTLIENYFEKIDTEEKAYWLHFLMADGCVSAGNHNDGTGNWHIRLSLATSDKERIEKFKEAIGANNPIVDTSYFDERTGEIYYRSYVIICSKKMVLDLIDKGCIPNKEQILQWPSFDKVPEYLAHHGVRGYLDGDGCNYRGRNNSGSKMMISFCSSLAYCEGLQKWLMENCNLNKTKIPFKDGIWNVRYGGRRQVSRIFHVLYDDATIWMPRKRDEIENVVYSLEYLEKTKNRRVHGLNWEEEQGVIIDYQSGTMTLPEMEKKWNVCGTTIKMILNRNGIKRNRSPRRNFDGKTIQEIIKSYKEIGLKETMNKFEIKTDMAHRIVRGHKTALLLNDNYGEVIGV